MIVAGTSCSLWAATVRTWVGPANGDWSTDINWSPSDNYPQAGDAVVVTNGSILLTDSTASLASFSITNATLVFSNWNTTLIADDIVIERDGSLTLPPAFTNAPAMSNRIHAVCATFTVRRGGSLNAAGRGYSGGALYFDGYGPGAGSSTAHYGGGGSHGGRGGNSLQGSGGPVYGVTNAPVTPGSGGGGNGAGNGGGSIWIEAGGAVEIHGVLTAVGNNATAHGGGGSGGSILIQCQTFAGSTNGLLMAAGGRSSYYSSGGGGGRIAVLYNAAAQTAMPKPKVRMSVARGSSPDSQTYAWSEPGTLYLPDARLLPPDMDHFPEVRLYGFDHWVANAVGVTNSRVIFAEPEFSLTVSNQVTVGAGGLLSMGSPYDSVGFQSLHCDALRLTNGGILQVIAGLTNGVTPDHGALVAVTGGVVVATNSWIYPVADPDNGGAPLFRAGSLTLDSGGGIDADGRGYGRGIRSKGKGPGGGNSPVGGYYGGGGGHGGAGGSGSQGSGGGAYGSSNAPITAGSGGGGNTWGDGGGVIRLEVEGTAWVNGLITADGIAADNHGGGGAGGSVFITADVFRGEENATIRARGGRGGGSVNDGGGGGGGRISIGIGISDADRDRLLAGETIAELLVYDSYAPYFGAWSVTNGLGAAGGHGQPGTKQFFQILDPAAKQLEVVGDPGNYGEPIPYFYGPNINLSQDAWLTNGVASPADALAGLRRALIGWTVTNAAGTVVAEGTTTTAVFRLTDDLVQTWRWTNEWLLTSVSADPTRGSVNSDTVDGWYTNGWAVAGITAIASNGFRFQRWMGDGVPDGRSFDNPLNVTMDQARTLQAYFTSTASVQRVWQGGEGSWFDPSGWEPADAPQAADDIVIGSGRVWLTNWSEVGSVVVSNGAILVFSNWPTFLRVSDAMTVGGTLTLPPAFDHTSGLSNRIHILCGAFTLPSGGSIDVRGRGYRGGVYGVSGYGPGAGTTTANYGGGGSHGGRGGAGLEGVAGDIYGVTNAPVTPGSGGGGTSAGSGGGAVRIAASGAVWVDGEIDAAGANSTGYGGGGSGGSIFLEGETVSGAGGLLTVAGGGSSYASEGGGGGRIAIRYNSAAQAGIAKPSIRLSAERGVAPSHASRSQPQPGTVFLTDEQFLPSRLDQYSDVRLFGIKSWTVDEALIVSSRVAFAEADFSMTVTESLTVGTNAVLSIGSPWDPVVFPTLYSDRLMIENGGTLEIYSGPTNGMSPDHGARIWVTNSMTVASNAWVYPVSDLTNGGAPWFRCGTLQVSVGGGFNADGRGYDHGYRGHGEGPGRGLAGGSAYYGGGGGHGGKGGDASQGAGGAPYGSREWPVTSGSGGGGNTLGGGGGVVRLNVAGPARIDGRLSANGHDAVYHGGGGAGGSILIDCQTLAGGSAAMVSAAGGLGGPQGTQGGGGGGGRIAVWIAVPESSRQLFLDGFGGGVSSRESFSSTFQGTVNVDFGSGVYDPPDARAADSGSIAVFNRRGTIFLFR